MDAAGEWLDQHRGLVGHRRRHGVQLAGMRDEHLAPSSPGVGAVAGLEPDLDRPLGDVVAKARAALGAARARRLDSAHLAAERRLDDDARSVVERAHHLVTRYEGITGQGIEVQRCMRSEEHTSELQSRSDLVCRLLLAKKKKNE